MIIWGTKTVRKKLGYVADFCPICRKITPFKLFRLGMAGHIYYIALGQGELVAHEIQCMDCMNSRRVDVMKYATFEKGLGSCIETLEQATFPKLRSVNLERLTTEEKIKRKKISELSDSERKEFLLEPFLYLYPAVEKRYSASTQFDGKSGLGCIATLLVPFFILVIGLSIFDTEKTKDIVAGAAVILFVCGLIYTIIQLALAPKTFMKNQIYPSLVMALAPLNPESQEILTCLAKLNAAGYKIGKKIKADRLINLLEYYKRQGCH